MQRVVALLLTVLLAACAGSNGGGTAQQAAATSSFPTQIVPAATRGNASRSIPSRPPVADYLLIDKSERLLVAYQNGRPIKAYRGLQFGDTPMGHKRFEGDERTPEGLYTIDTRNPQSRFHLSLRISYPNRQDRAFAAQYGRSPGGDIFIHGQPTGRPGRMRGDWTDGCIALSNTEIEELWQLVPDGTPIEIRP
ncbi:ErfK/YbiS/YcfS/YnhG family protein [Erythrobacter sp. NAP1]|uniref:L,D-transpeptidase family protein n=1 Tax=Erythrobacter sp. NAP1 TaxID=237727 RepID=UPI0000686CF0|nr:L,D-transpeptidase family protein [Erythrobacter sp. NAP1]EAQ29357.1 ErfK/YbiS/YcfS/YnhG family protein [Erythrobacter sp. NAP1]